MRRTVLPILLALAAGAGAEVKITGAYPTDRAGKAITPQLGEPFYLTVTLSVSKESKPYRMTIDSPAGLLDSGALNFGVNAPGNYWMRQGAIVPLFDGPMDITVSCSAAKKPFKLRLTPASPKTAFSYYSSQKLDASYGATVEFDRLVTKALAWVPVAQSDASQIVETTEEPVRTAFTNEWQQPVGLVEASAIDRIEVSAAAKVTASSVRTNLSLLRAVPMSAVSTNAWLTPESRVQSTAPEIVAFAGRATKGMNAKTPVADVALALYSAVLKRSVYAKTNALPDALTALRTGKGECGDLSALFVASCRAAGVPARTVSGITMGNDSWHVWAEFNVPGKGWVPVDPAYAVSLRPRSAYPLFFGVVPEMRGRLALARGFSHSVGGQSTGFLQTPQIFTFDSDPKLRSAQFWSRLSADARTL